MHKRRKAAVNRFSRVNVADILRYRGRGYKSGTSRRPLSALAPGHHPLPSISARRFSRLALSGDWRRNPTARRARRGGVKFINRVLADQRRAPKIKGVAAAAAGPARPPADTMLSSTAPGAPAGAARRDFLMSSSTMRRQIVVARTTRLDVVDAVDVAPVS